MRIKYTIICLLASMGIANAQFQNYILKTPDNASKTYVGRDYVRLLPGYSFSASSGKTMNAKVSSGLTTTDANAFLAAANPTGSTNIDALTAINTSLAVGQIPISSSVSATGAKCYNVPIDIVPGRQGFQPNISLSYNSQAGNGVVGMGWTISGLSSIERVNKNIYYDDENEIPNMSVNDAFALDGNRFILVRGSWTSTQISYSTISGNIKAIAYINGNKVNYFKVFYPNGNVAIYGYTSSSNPNPQMTYPITELKDKNGNIITYSYYFDGSQTIDNSKWNISYMINEINYGQCTNGGDFGKIKFVYGDRSDKVISFDPNCATSWSLSKRLSMIQVLVNSDSVRSYRLNYSNTDQRNLLSLSDYSKLIQINSSVNGKNMNPLKFYYGDNATPTIISSVCTTQYANFDINLSNIIRGKFDKNSQNDALLIFPKTPIYSQTSGANYSVIYPSSEQIKIYQGLNSETTYPTSLTTGDGFEDVFAANVDGKGRDEVVKVNMHFLDGSNFESVTFNVYGVDETNGGLKYLYNYDCFIGNSIYNSGYGYSVTPFKYFTGNFTGKGKTEVLGLSKDNQIRNNAFLVDLDGTGSCIFTGQNFVNILNDGEFIYPMDVDGDGQTEIVRVTATNSLLYKYVQGSGFVNISTWNLTTSNFSERQILFADLNGDGNIDIIRSPKPQELVYENNPTIHAPSWFSDLKVSRPYVACDVCGYIHMAPYRSVNNGALHGAKYIQKNGSAIIDNYLNVNWNFDPVRYGPWDAVTPPMEYNYPNIINNNQYQVACPGCGKIRTFTIPQSDGRHCWVCGTELSSSGSCRNHSTSINKSNWSYLRPPTPKSYSDWIYQYTNGRTIVKADTINGITRANDHKYSIHEINGDETPDLIAQPGDGSTMIFPFDIVSKSFKNCYLSTNACPHSYEYIGYDMNSKNTYSSLIGLGSNKITILNFPQNHTRSTMMSVMVNSLGVVEKTDYSQLSQGINYTAGNASVFPYTDYSGPLWVTQQTSSMANKQILSNLSYSYAGAVLHTQGLGLCGFSSMATTDLMTNKDSRTEFDPSHYGVVKKQTTDEIESVFTYDFSNCSYMKLLPLLTHKTLTDKLRGNTINESYLLYDDYGNPGKIITDYGSGIFTTTNLSYQNVVSGFDYMLLGLPLSKEVINTRDGQSFKNKITYEYYSTDNRLHYSRNYIKDNLLSETEYIYYTTFGTLHVETLRNVSSNDYLSTSYTYDTDNSMLKTKTDPYGLVTTYTNDLNLRLVGGVTDYKNNTVTYGYDDWRRKTTEIATIGTDAITSATSYQWNNGTDAKYLIKQTLTTTGQPATTSYTDVFGRETRRIIQGFDGTDVITDKEYDNYGRLATTSAPYKSGSSKLLTTYLYDNYDRPTTVTGANGSVTNYSYSGNTVTQNTDGVVTTATTDATGKTVSTTDAGGTISYVYRADGQPASVNAAGVVTGFEYNDNYNRQTKLIDPSAGEVQTVYNDATHAMTQTWSSGKQITTTYNMYGQPTSRTTPDFTTSYGYVEGKPQSITSSNGTSKVYTYDPYGRLNKINETANGKTYEEVYGYTNGRINSVVYNTGTPYGLNTLASVVYKYNNYGYLYRLEDGSGNRLREITDVNELGQEKSVTFGNNLVTNKSYTPEGFITGIQTGSIQNVSYNFNRVNGTLNSRTDGKYVLTENFTYDNLYRLTNSGSGTVNYNPNGNIHSKSDAGTYAYGIGGKPYQLSNISDTTLSNGLAQPLDIAYTVNSRPTSITGNGYTASFSYNDDYDRVTEQIQNSNSVLTKTFLSEGKYEVEATSNGDIQRLYVDGSPYDASVVLEKNGGNNAQLYYLHRDYLGSVTQISDNNGNLAAEYSYDAWGRMRNVSNWQLYAQGSQPVLKFGRGYTGHEHLNQFGLINMNARLYDPVLGRFLAPDPLVTNPDETNGYNRYAYASNNPLMYVDLDGEAGDYPGGWWWNKDITVPYRPDYNPNSSGNNFYYPYSGSSSGSGYNNANQGAGSGGYYGDGGTTALGNILFSFLREIIYGHKPAYSASGLSYKPAMAVSPKPKPVVLSKPVGTGASTVYAGGGRSMRGNVGNYLVGIEGFVGMPIWMEYAICELGITEIPGPANNNRIIEYHSATSLKAKNDETAWCSSFVNWTLKQTGIDGTNNARALSWVGWGQSLQKPAFGSIAIIDWGKGKGHVGFVAGETPSHSIVLLGGNQHDQVRYSAFSRSLIFEYVYPNGFSPNYSLPQINLKKTTNFSSTR